MYQNNNFFEWLFKIGIMAVGAWIIMEIFVFLFPFLVFFGLGYIAYWWGRSHQLRHALKEKEYVINIEKKKQKGKIIDAEYEIIDEKTRE